MINIEYKADLDTKASDASLVFVTYADVSPENPARAATYLVEASPVIEVDDTSFKFAWAKTVAVGQTVQQSLQEDGRMSEEGLSLLGDIVLIPKQHIRYQGPANAKP